MAGEIGGGFYHSGSWDRTNCSRDATWTGESRFKLGDRDPEEIVAEHGLSIVNTTIMPSVPAF
jgi:hypothetical protein